MTDPLPQPSLSRHQKRLTWASFALLVGLIVLSVLIIAVDLNDRGLFANQLIFILNVTVATSAAVIASSISGFFELFFKERLGEKREFVLRAAGGFAVFILVMYMSPSNQIEKLDAVYARGLSACEDAVLESKGGAESLCAKLVEAYPDEPQPRKFLARYWHINAHSADDLRRARDGYLEALGLLKVDINSLSETSAGFGEEQGELSDWGEIIRRTIAASADYSLARWQEDGTVEQARSSLRALLPPLAFLNRHYAPNVDVVDEFEFRILNAKILFYLSILEPGSAEAHLSASLDAFRHPMNNGRRYFRSELEALIVVGALEHFGTNRDLNTIKLEIASSLPTLWQEQIAHRTGSQNIKLIETIVKGYRLGVRVELYRVTQYIGSSKYYAQNFERILTSCEPLLQFFDQEFPLRS